MLLSSFICSRNVDKYFNPLRISTYFPCKQGWAGFCSQTSIQTDLVHLFLEHLTSMSFCLPSFHRFAFCAMNYKLFCLHYSRAFSSSILSRCPSYRKLCSHMNSIFSMPVISWIVWLLMPSLSVFPHIMHTILISVVYNFLLSFLKAQHFAP